MPTLLEDLIGDLNSNVFYREFSYSKNVFVPSAAASELEFADHVVWIDDLLVIYQLKERDAPSVQSEDGERKWFKKKVLRAATKQVRDTLQYLKKHPAIEITNQRGHTLNVSSAKVKHLVKLIVYKPSGLLPADCLAVKCHVRPEPVGLIHIVTWEDYQGICETLITPAEVAEYFDFREDLLTNYPASALPSEQALVGQFLQGGTEETPDERNASLVSGLITDLEAFDISYLLDGIAERIEYQEGTGSDVDYYGIIAEFAKLTRLELKEVKTRLRLSLEAANENRSRRPMRIIGAASRCGFAFIPVDRELTDHRVIGLTNLAQIAKYESHLDRQVAVSVAKEEGGDYLIDWCLLDYPWQEDPALETAVREQNPFGELRSEVRAMYHIQT
jgi:hypothetical protein